MVTDNDGSADTLIEARWIIPATADKAVLDDHSLVIRDGRIVDILPTATARARYQAEQHLALPEHALIPGLVNAHGHSAMTLMRGIADDLPLETWLQSHIWPLEGHWMSESFVTDGTQLAIAEMICGGTTCYADMYFFPDCSARAAVQAGIRTQLCAPILDMPTVWASDADEYINKAARLHDEYRHSDMISVAFGPHAPYTVSDAPLRRVATLADELDIPVHMHVHETAREVSDSVAADGRRPLQRLSDAGLMNPHLVCVHVTQLLEEELGQLADCGVHAVHCPESNLKLASGFCGVDRLLRHGINVALGTDGAASNNDLDMIGEMRSAALLAKAVADDASALPAHQVLRMATINGARAMGLEDRIGTLETGKFADVAAIDLSGINNLPVYDPVSQIVYSSHARQVRHVWIGGRQVLRDGDPCTLDLGAIREHTRAWQQRLAEDDRQ